MESPTCPRAPTHRAEGQHRGQHRVVCLTPGSLCACAPVPLTRVSSCFMNSAIQCLSHTPLLTQYFLSHSYRADINTVNEMGAQGRLAIGYANLVSELWMRRRRCVNPRVFKNVIAKFNDQFAGNEQHDAQELLSFLLSGLSEDLNRIEKKPYIEHPDSDGRPDVEVTHHDSP